MAYITAVFIFITLTVCAAKKQPHIIMIVADDLGWNDVSWHNPDVITPNMAKLAASGTILEQSYVQPVCTPTRAALMTGRYPFTIGRQHRVIDSFMPTGMILNSTILPQSLKKEGYSTHAVGKWHLGFCSWEYTPTYRGFDTFHGFYTGGEDYYSHIRTKPNKHYDSGYHAGFDFRNNKLPDFTANGTYSAYDFAQHVDGLLHERDPKDPLFLYMAFQSVHAPLMVPDNYTDLYSHIKDKDRRTYLGMVTAMDEAVGRIVESLKSTGHYENSIIVFTTDNGGSTNKGGNNFPLRGKKATIWEGGTRGSAFVHSPLLPHNGIISHRLTHVTDWYPTFVRLAGGKLDQKVDGIDQWDALNHLDSFPRQEMIYNIDDENGMLAGIRLGNYKLIVGNPRNGKWIQPPEMSNNIKTKSNNPHRKKSISKNKSFDRIKVNSILEADDPLMKMKMSTKLQLYNLNDDPNEKIDLAYKEPKILIRLLKRLLSYLPEFVPADLPPDDYSGDTSNYDGVWSPGWC